MVAANEHRQARRGRILYRVAVGVLSASSFALALYFLRYGRVSLDEGWYLYAARLVWEGQLPYRDFAFFQAPVLPYLYGLAQQLLGVGLETGRLTSLAFSAGTVALGARLSHEVGGRLATLFFLVCIALTPIGLWSFTTTRTEPLSAFLLMLSAFLLFREPTRIAPSSGAMLAATLALGTRISSLPLAGVVFGWVWVRHRHSRRDFALVLLPSVLALFALGALVLAAGLDSTFFNLVASQAGRHSQLAPVDPWTALDFLERRLKDLLVLRTFYGVVPVLAAIAAIAAVPLYRSTSTRDLAVALLGLTSLGLATYLPNLAPRAVFPLYYSSVLPLFAVIGSAALGGLHERVSGVWRPAVLAMAAVLVLYQAAGFAERRAVQVSAFPDLSRVSEGADYLASVAPPDTTLATMETYLAVESGLTVAPGWEMSLFSYFPARSDPDVRTLGVLNEGIIAEQLRSDEIGAVVLSDKALGVLVGHTWRGIGRKRRSEAWLRAALPGLERYRLVRVFPGFGQFRDHLYVLLPKER
jgi:hypothetical protein